MIIGIDVSQIAYENTGVSNYLKNLIEEIIKKDKKNNYVLFFSSLRNHFKLSWLNLEKLPKNVVVKEFKFPPTLLDLIWNKLHIFPIEKLIGNVDIFITSDWTEPPVRHAKKATIVYDLVVYKFPKETSKKIINVQKRKLKWVRKESDMIFCISQSTAQDLKEIFNIDKSKLNVIYPGIF